MLVVHLVLRVPAAGLVGARAPGLEGGRTRLLLLHEGLHVLLPIDRVQGGHAPQRHLAAVLKVVRQDPETQVEDGRLQGLHHVLLVVRAVEVGAGHLREKNNNSAPSFKTQTDSEEITRFKCLVSTLITSTASRFLVISIYLYVIDVPD